MTGELRFYRIAVVALAVGSLACLPRAAAANDKEEVEYLLAGMLQEREKLRSGSCTIEGKDVTHGAYEMKYLMKGSLFRFTRTKRTTPPEIQHVADNGDQIAFWDNSTQCGIIKSASSERQSLGVKDPRHAGIQMLRTDSPTIQQFIEKAREVWSDKASVSRDKSLRTITFVSHHKHEGDPVVDLRVVLQIDTARGFAPALHKAERILLKLNPQKVEQDWQFTADWKEVDGVWVPVHVRETGKSGQFVQEQKFTWDWVNRDVDDREFTLAALGVPADVKCLDLRSGGGKALPEDDGSSSTPKRIRKSQWQRFMVLGAAVIALAALIWALRRRSPPAPTLSESPPGQAAEPAQGDGGK